MNAKKNSLGRVQAIFDIITQTRNQIESVGLTQESFLNPSNDVEDLIAEGVDL